MDTAAAAITEVSDSNADVPSDDPGLGNIDGQCIWPDGEQILTEFEVEIMSGDKGIQVDVVDDYGAAGKAVKGGKNRCGGLHGQCGEDAAGRGHLASHRSSAMDVAMQRTQDFWVDAGDGANDGGTHSTADQHGGSFHVLELR